MSDAKLVVLDARKLTEARTGIGQYVLELARALPALAPDINFQLLTDRPVAPDQVPDGCRHVVVGPARPRGRWAKAYSPWWMNVLVPRHLTSSGAALFHATNFALPSSLSVRSVVTIHDIAFVKLPDAYSPVYRLYARAQLRNAVRRARAIIVDSTATRDDLLGMFGAVPGPVFVIHLGVGAQYRIRREPDYLDRVKRTLRLPNRFLLHIGVIQRRKNLVVLLKAASGVIRSGLVDGVVIAGSDGLGAGDVRRAALELGIASQVFFPGYVAEDLVAGLYNLAAAVVVPSKYEGFGMPVLEAMACGVPVVASRASSLPEVAGDAALLFDPDSVQQLADCLRSLLSDAGLSTLMAMRGRERARQFEWSAAAAKHLEVYRLALSS